MSARTHLAVGAGNMGGALIKGQTSGRRKVVDPKHLIVLTPRLSPTVSALVEAGACHLKAPGPALSSVDTVMLAVKPQVMATVAEPLAPYLSEGTLVISVLAGTSVRALEAAFPGCVIIRAMPNTPSAVGGGMTAFTCGDGVSEAQKAHAEALLAAVGKVHEVESEALIDTVTAVSGSGPAYLFHMVEALAAAAIAAGLPEDLAPDFARQTIIGSAKLLETDERSASELRRAVTSPNGTTQAALDVLMGEGGLSRLMRDTVAAAQKRAKELGQET